MYQIRTKLFSLFSIWGVQKCLWTSSDCTGKMTNIPKKTFVIWDNNTEQSLCDSLSMRLFGCFWIWDHTRFGFFLIFISRWHNYNNVSLPWIFHGELTEQNPCSVTWCLYPLPGMLTEMYISLCAESVSSSFPCWGYTHQLFSCVFTLRITSTEVQKTIQTVLKCTPPKTCGWNLKKKSPCKGKSCEPKLHFFGSSC